MANILITGGAGFIGSHVARHLLAREDDVVLLDDFNDRYDPNLKEARMKNMFSDTKAPTLARGSITDREFLQSVFSEHSFDTVVHLAAWASVLPSIENPHIYTEVNVDGTVNILEEARKQNVKNIVAASSSSVYGGNTNVPFTETDDITKPVSPYAATKVATEVMGATWHHIYKIPVTMLRFFTVYGPWGRPEMAIFKFTKAIMDGDTVEMRGKTTQRDFTYVDDIVQGVVASIDKPNGYTVYNLGEHDAVPLPRMIKALEDALGKKANVEEVPLPASDLPRTLANVDKAKQELGYNPTTKIEEGVKKFAQWYTEWYVPNFKK